MWSLQIPLHVVDLGLQWTQSRRRRRRRIRTKNGCMKDCTILEVRKKIAVGKEIAALGGEGVIDAKVTKEVLNQKGPLATLAWILTWIEQVAWVEQVSHSK
jgi:hypothetical protein